MTETDSAPIRRVARNRMTAADQRGFYADVLASGATAQVSTTVEPSRPLPAHAAQAAGLDPGTPMLARVRHMAADGQPLQLATSYFPAAVAAELPVLAEQNTGPGGMYGRLEEAGHTLHQIDIVGARSISDEETEALQLDDPYALTVIRITRDAESGEVLEIGDLLVAPGRQELVYDV